MIATEAKRTELSERLEGCRRRHEGIWDAFARDYDKKAEAVSYLVELAFSLSPEQVAQMGEASTRCSSKLAVSSG